MVWTAGGERRDLTAEGLALLDVGNVHLDRGEVDRGQSVLKGPAVVGQGPGVYHQAIDPGTGLVDPVDQLAFVVRLKCLDLQPQLGSPGADPILELGQGGVSIDMGLAHAEQVEVGAIEDENPLHHA